MLRPELRRGGGHGWMLVFESDGAQRFAGELDEAGCRAVEGALAGLPCNKAGIRIPSLPDLRPMLSSEGAIGRTAAGLLGGAARAVRAILFDKNATTNWGLGWHQDRTIVVEERAAVDGFGPWTIKAGLVQVEPPVGILERMVTLRVHLDPVDQSNAPLAILPGSHRLGRLAESRIALLAARSAVEYCLAERGDIWAYATLIVHGSRPADPPRRRRVLQLDYTRDELPYPLRWHELG